MSESLPRPASLEEALARCCASVGTADFIAVLVALPGFLLDCERALVVRYTRFARPEFLLNTSLTPAAIDVYQRGLYQLDPLLRQVESGRLRPVCTFRQIHAEEGGGEFYDEIYRHGMIHDELAIMIPVAGGGCLALCFDRGGSEFSVAEIDEARRWWPLLQELHRLHLRTCLLNGLGSLFGGGSVCVLALAETGAVFYRNDAWTRLAHPLDESSLIARALQFPAGTPASFGGGIVYWDVFASPREDVRQCRLVFFETDDAGEAPLDVHARLTDFCHRHGLSPRESEIVLQMTRGCHNASIARRLGLTVGTIKNYKRRLYEKLDVTNEREVFTLIITHLFGDPAQT